MIAAANNGDEEESGDESGGRGRFVSNDPHRIRGELAMIATAVKRRWDMDETKRKQLANEVLDAAIDATDPEIKFKGASIIVRMEGQNQADEHKLTPSQVNVRHQIDVDSMSYEELDKLIAGDFSAIEDASGSGEEAPPASNGESA